MTSPGKILFLVFILYHEEVCSKNIFAKMDDETFERAVKFDVNRLRNSLSQYVLQLAQDQSKLNQNITSPASIIKLSTPLPTATVLPPKPALVEMVQQTTLRTPSTVTNILVPSSTVKAQAGTPQSTTLSTIQLLENHKHIFNQVNRIVASSLIGNISGIVDESLLVAPVRVPVRNLVNGILTVVFCNTFEFFSARCRNRFNNQREYRLPKPITSSRPERKYIR